MRADVGLELNLEEELEVKGDGTKLSLSHSGVEINESTLFGCPSIRPSRRFNVSICRTIKTCCSWACISCRLPFLLRIMH